MAHEQEIMESMLRNVWQKRRPLAHCLVHFSLFHPFRPWRCFLPYVHRQNSTSEVGPSVPVSSISNSSSDSCKALINEEFSLLHPSCPFNCDSSLWRSSLHQGRVLLDFCQHLTKFGFDGNLSWMCLRERADQTCLCSLLLHNSHWLSPWTSSQLRALHITSLILPSPGIF